MSGKNADYLSHFWSLAEIESSTRIAASEDILNTLKSLSDDPLKSEDFHASIEYTLKRLVKGLKSSRGGARQGFATTLSIVLSTFFKKEKETRLSEVWSHALEVTKCEGKDRGFRVREAIFGRVFAMLAILRSRASISEDTVKSMREVASELYETKPWLRHLLIEVYVEMNESGVDLSHNAPDSEHDMYKMLNKSPIESPEILSLAFAMSLSKTTPKPIKKRIVENVTHFKNMSTWTEALRRSDYVCPAVHTVWDRILKMHAAKSIQIFETIFDDEFLKKRERKYLSLKILGRLVEAGTVNESNVQRVLTSKLLHTLRTHASNKKSYLHAPVKSVLELFQSASPSFRVAVATCLLSMDGSGSRDSALLSQILDSLKLEHLKTYVSKLIEREDEFAAQALYSVGLTILDQFTEQGETLFREVLSALVKRESSDSIVGLCTEACATKHFTDSVLNILKQKKKGNKILKKIVSKIKKDPSNSLSNLLLVLGIQVAVGGEEDLVSDLLTSADAKDDEKAIAISVDVCVSLLMQETKRMSSMRVLVSEFFKSLCPRLQTAHLEDILDIVKSEDPMSLLQVVEEESSEDEDEEEEDEDVDEVTRQMDREDAALAKIIQLRNEKSTQKQKAKELIRLARLFQLRVLSLVERFVVFATSSSTASPLALVLPSHLLSALRVTSLASGEGGECIALRDRLRSIYKRLVTAKHICKGQTLDVALKAEAQAQTKELCSLALARNVKLLPDLDGLASNGLMFLYRVLAANGVELSSEAVADAYAPILDDLIAKKRGKLSKPKMLEDVITRHPVVGSSLAPLLIEYCVSKEGDRVVPRTLFQRHLCVVLLTSLVKRVPSTFSLDSLCACFTRLCSENPFQKKNHIKTLMSLGQTLVRTSKTRGSSVTKEMVEVVEKLSSSEDGNVVMVRSAGVMLAMLNSAEKKKKKRKKSSDERESKKVKKRKTSVESKKGVDVDSEKKKKKKKKKKRKRKD